MKSSAVLNSRQERTAGSTSHFGSSKAVSGSSAILVGGFVQRHHGDPAHPTSPIYRSSCCLTTERSETNTISRFRADVGAVLQADMRSGFPQPHLDFDHTDYEARGQPSPFFSDHQSPRIPCQNSYERRDSKAASFRGRRRLCLIASNNAALT